MKKITIIIVSFVLLSLSTGCTTERQITIIDQTVAFNEPYSFFVLNNEALLKKSRFELLALVDPRSNIMKLDEFCNEFFNQHNLIVGNFFTPSQPNTLSDIKIAGKGNILSVSITINSGALDSPDSVDYYISVLKTETKSYTNIMQKPIE